MNDCDKCYLGLMDKRYVGKDIKIKYLFRKLYYDEKDDLIAKFDIDTLKEDIVFSDSLYKIFNNKTYSTSIHLFSNKICYANFPVKAIDKNLYLLKNFDTINVNNLPKFFNYALENGKLFLHDRNKNEIKIMELNEEIPVIHKFKLTDKITKLCFNSYFKDTFRYNNFHDSLEIKQIPRIINLRNILSFNVSNDTLIVLANFLYDEICLDKGKKDTCYFNFYSIIKLFGKNIEVKTLRRKGEGTVLTYDAKRLGILGSKLFLNDGNIYTNLIKKDFDFNETDRYIAKLSITDDYYEDDKTMKTKMPKLNYKYPVVYISDYVFHYPYIFHSFSTELINIETNKNQNISINYGDLSYINKTVPEFGNPIKINFKVVDFTVKNDSLKVLFIREQKMYIQQFNLNTGKSVPEKLFLEFEDNTSLRSEVEFQDYNTLILFPQAENYFVRVKDN